jgi:hypothetical protein
VIPEQEFYGKKDWRDLIILYPNERARTTKDGLYVKRNGERIFEPYHRIYQVVDYGALTDKDVSSLKLKGIAVGRGLREGPRSGLLPLYPSPEFVTKLRWLEQNSPLRKRLLESVMLSTIIATRRLARRGGEQLQVLPNRQLLEYFRMRGEAKLTISRALAYEARVNILYWSIYKTLLRMQGLEFQSRVRDRFVREIVNSITARARGYSPANAAINFLHQRRLLLCRQANVRTGIGWVGCEGVLHVAKREPSIGLLLDLSDSFKLADREFLLNAVIRREVSREDFVARPGKHRVWFFHPTQEMIGKLDLVGSDADSLRVDYRSREATLTGAYEEFATSFVKAVEGGDLGQFHPFVYGDHEDKAWIESRTT